MEEVNQSCLTKAHGKRLIQLPVEEFPEGRQVSDSLTKLRTKEFWPEGKREEITPRLETGEISEFMEAMDRAAQTTCQGV